MIEVDALNISYYLNKPITDNIAIYNIKNSSPLYPIIYWYILHNCEVGYNVYIKEDSLYQTPVNLEYFCTSFKKIDEVDGWVYYKKISKLLVENSRGLDEWTFGIPVGPNDASMLNILISRILKLGILKFEIILCGQPGVEFKYKDKVRIVGKDILNPLVHITKKKNIIAQEAKYKNLCILHDRVLLPCNFIQAIEELGDVFPIFSFQSIYIRDKLGLLLTRYSDYGYIDMNQLLLGNNNKFSNKLDYIDRSFFMFANPKRYNSNRYLTGSIYICKTKLWNQIKQDESLFWSEYEDIEFAIRCHKYGAPHIINPYSLTCSMRARSTLLEYGSIIYEDITGQKKISKYNPLLAYILPQRSISDITLSSVINNYHIFLDIYNIQVSIGNLNNPIEKFRVIGNIIGSLEIVRTKEFAEKLYADINKYLINEQKLRSEEKKITDIICSNLSDKNLKILLLNHISQLRHQVYLSIFTKYHPSDEDDFKFNIHSLSLFFATKRLLLNRSLELKITSKNLSNTLRCFMEDINGS
ncbi:hypothetical protein [Candidatus Enterovibrio altilux]|uniref:hypothetical protein n=1 Tax=Candidatus Enterovibrio altilux TaxID=1927128 RepID=UPI001237FB99|nr:hypothetical protein [Candidatus Enterovibrio luxaltus]